jgi:probable HAF family extracellular repeat protein
VIHAAYFTGIGGLQTGDFYSSQAMGISGDGLVVVGCADSLNPSIREAFRWTRSDGLVGIGDLVGGEFFSCAYGASNDGSVIVGVGRSDADEEAFRWTEAAGMVSIASGLRSQAKDVSADGSVIVGWKTGLFNYEAFRWTEATGMVGLGTVDGAVQSFAEGVSANGEIVVGWTNTEGFRWTEPTGIEGLGDLDSLWPYPVSAAYGISPNGSVIVGEARNSDWSDEAFRLSESVGMEGLGILPGQFLNAASDVTADGSVIVGLPSRYVEGEAFIWDEIHGLRSLKTVLEVDYGLDLSGWTLVAATSISDDGTMIVGYGVNPEGYTEGWVANLVDVLEVGIDIIPGNERNNINPRSAGDIWVAVLSNTQFDPLQVVVSSVLFGPTETLSDRHRVKDVNGDGLSDLLLRFNIGDAGLTCGDTQATIIGVTIEGQSIMGTDIINTVGCKP